MDVQRCKECNRLIDTALVMVFHLLFNDNNDPKTLTVNMAVTIDIFAQS